MNDKKLVIKILSDAFQDNKSVNLVVKDKSKIPGLMSYSYELAKRRGKIFISDNRKAVALILLSDKNRFSFRIMLESLKLALNVIGLKKLFTVLKRESAIKKLHPESPYIHLWYIGVEPESFGKGYGAELLDEIIAFAKSIQRDIYLETSVARNIKFYESRNFENYANVESDIPFTLMLFRKKSDKAL